MELIGIEPTTSSMPCRRAIGPDAVLTLPGPVAGLQGLQPLWRFSRSYALLRGVHRANSRMGVLPRLPREQPYQSLRDARTAFSGPRRRVRRLMSPWVQASRILNMRLSSIIGSDN